MHLKRYVYIFFSRYVHTECIGADFNQAGLETEPVKYKGKFYGFQSKYFSPSMDYKQIEHSVQLALTSYPDLMSLKYFIIVMQDYRHRLQNRN